VTKIIDATQPPQLSQNQLQKRPKTKPHVFDLLFVSTQSLFLNEFIFYVDSIFRVLLMIIKV
jgi:hypothetical protein